MNLKNILKTTMLTTVLTFVLTGCGEKTYSKEDFLKDDKLRKEYLNKCKNGDINKNSQNCINARSAEDKAIMNKWKNNMEDQVFSSNKSVSKGI